MTEQNNIETERRFILTHEEAEALKRGKNWLKQHRIEQIYLSTEEELTLRMRRKFTRTKRTAAFLNPTYTLTIKKPTEDEGSCIEIETEISEHTYEAARPDSVCNGMIISKVRTEVQLPDGFIGEVDEFNMDRHGRCLIILEVESPKAAKFNSPFPPGREITGNYEFSNAYMAEHMDGLEVAAEEALRIITGSEERQPGDDEPILFTLNSDRAVLAHKFMRSHKCGNHQGGRHFTFSFTPWGVGDGAAIKCADCNRSIDLESPDIL